MTSEAILKRKAAALEGGGYGHCPVCETRPAKTPGTCWNLGGPRLTLTCGVCGWSGPAAELRLSRLQSMEIRLCALGVFPWENPLG